MTNSMVYFKEGKLVFESGLARVYNYNNSLFLEYGEGHTCISDSNYIMDYVNQLGDLPTGNVLEIGLGLGISSKYIMSLPQVNSLTSVEIHKDVIDIYDKVKELDTVFNNKFGYKKHKIIHSDGLSYIYNTASSFDFIFLDFYSTVDEDSLPLIKDMVMACKINKLLNNKAKIIAWCDDDASFEIFNEFNSIFL